jgi:hypothetical protein
MEALFFITWFDRNSKDSLRPTKQLIQLKAVQAHLLNREYATITN